ncbi:MAG: GAF domain-containing protein [Anaerolineales bacterium]|nr:GAF domain-containing protein [Anaerolineales bacterium]
MSQSHPFTQLAERISQISYTLLRPRRLRADFLLRRGILYALLSILVATGYVLLVSGLSLIFGEVIAANNPLLIGLTVLALAVLLTPLRSRLQQGIDALFLRGHIVPTLAPRSGREPAGARRPAASAGVSLREGAYQEHIQDFTQELTRVTELSGILRRLRDHIMNALTPGQLHIYVYDPLNDRYLAASGEDDRPTSDIHFAPNNPFVETLRTAHKALFIDEANLPARLQSEKVRLALLGAQLFIPLSGNERLIGWLALGAPRSADRVGAALPEGHRDSVSSSKGAEHRVGAVRNYTGQDITFLNLLGEQAALAIERAQVVFDLERRLREMNILARVAQGVNITMAFDDILELFYAQTKQILPLDDLHLTLYDKANNYFYFAFCLENDHRLTDRENIPLLPNQGLSPEVIRSRHSILSEDYGRECQTRGVTPLTSGVYAWAGVPLNAGAETIGALSVGSRDATSVYTPRQVDLIQAIADQAAGAIVKARLLQETERRARQLTTLNEITRQLTSTLETEPLLQNILESAVGILNCEAGSLFLVDEQSDEMIFKVTVGPVAADLIGQRMPAGSGIVGKAVRTRAPVIVNNVQATSNWFSATDQDTGFVTRAVLAVPLQIKERVTGALEVINRKDGRPFAEEDQNLLAAFAGQAAVAIENAKLYTLTDQELNARVEELSVMQRIDRELNASLDVARAMRITLDWAMRQSAADAGLIGILEEGGMRVMAQQGYEDLLLDNKDTLLPLNQPAMRAAVKTGQPQRVTLEAGQRGILPEARQQAIVPVRREANVIGLICLESTSPDSQPAGEVNFLTRLSDHAAIAIANAQLYSAVQAANTAKSEFVSLVAHELKNPMTSIKGYTELLAASAVGPTNAMQTNFLKTILSNVERMNTLVSDLNDISKIEAGRLRLEFKAIALSEVLDEVTRSSKRQIEEKKQIVTLMLPANLPKIWADATRLAQVLINLVSNANKYTPEAGEINIRAERSSNQWDADGAPQVVHVWVKDSGIGISLEDQKKIFQKFFRSEDEKARESSGTGLGLNITKSLIEMQGGRIWFESEFRQGTTFHITVPVAEG